jgi:hypothetical protein
MGIKYTFAMMVFMISILVFSCSKSSNPGNAGSPDCSGAAKSFASDVLPVFQSSCATNAGCHAAGSIAGPGALSNYNQIYNSRNTISISVATGRMPQGSTLPAVQYNAILCWINQGAPNN